MMTHTTAFEWDAYLSSGGMSDVFTGRHASSGAPVVLKVWAPRRAPGAMSTFLREAQAVARLDHEGIVRVRDLGRWSGARSMCGVPVEEGSPFLIADFVQGRPLDASPTLPPSVAVARVVELLGALAHAHARGVLHRDIKPQNVIEREDGALVLIDFGLAMLEGADIVEGGTPLFMAPEQLTPRRGFGEGPWTDVWSIGALLHHMITGHPPFVGTTLRQVHEAKLEGWRGTPPLPPGLSDWLHRALAAAPEARFASAVHAMHALAKTANGDDPKTSSARVAPASASLLVSSVLDLDASSHWASSQAQETPTMIAPDATPGVLLEELHSTSGARAMRGAELGIFSFKRAGMVGRSPQARALWSCVLGGARPLAIVGPPGVGKSTMARWAVTSAHEAMGDEHIWVSFTAQREDAESWSRALATHLGLTLAHADEVEARTQRRLLRLGVLGGKARAEVARAASVPEDDWSIEDVVRGLDVLARAHHARTGRPMLLVLDDLHTSTTAFDVVRELLELGTPCAPMATARPDPGASSRMAPEGWEIHRAEPMGDDALGEALRRALAVREEVVRHILERASGNPLYAMEFLRDAISRGLIEEHEDGFGWAPGADIPLPRALEELCLGRVDELTTRWPTLERFLEAASHMGHLIDASEWHALADACGTRSLALDALAEHELVAHREDVVELEHPMIAESLVARVARQARSAHAHKLCLDAIEEVHLTRMDASPRRLRHALEAGEVKRAFEALRDVNLWRPVDLGGQALSTMEKFIDLEDPYHDVIFGISRLMRMLNSMHLDGSDALIELLEQRVQDIPEGHPGRVRASQLVDVYAFNHAYMTGEYERAQEVWHTKLDGVVTGGDAFSCHRLMIELLTELEEWDAAAEHVARATSILPEDDWSRGWFFYAVACLELERGRTTSFDEACERALEHFAESDTHAGAGAMLERRAMHAFIQGRVVDALEHMQHALEALDAGQDGFAPEVAAGVVRLQILLGRDLDVASELAALAERDPPPPVADIAAYMHASNGTWNEVHDAVRALAMEANPMRTHDLMVPVLEALMANLDPPEGVHHSVRRAIDALGELLE